MNYAYSSRFKKKLVKLSQIDKKLALKIITTIESFAKNPHQNSFRLHKIVNVFPSVWGISVNMSIRIIFSYEGDTIVLHDFGKHEEVY